MQCFDFLIEKFHELYFTPVKIPAHLKKTLDDSELEYISADGSTTCRYILLLAETCQVIIHESPHLHES